jgi:hypothetical protein
LLISLSYLDFTLRNLRSASLTDALKSPECGVRTAGGKRRMPGSLLGVCGGAVDRRC